MNDQKIDMLPQLVFSADGMVEEHDHLSNIVELALESGICLFEASPSVVYCLKDRLDNPFSLLSSISLLDVQNGLQARQAVEKQLQSCNIDHFDWFYLEDVCEGTIVSKERDLLDILSALQEFVRRGTIGRLGFGFAGMEETLRRFLETYGSDFSFCVIQLNYMDWFLKKARGKVHVLQNAGMTIIGKNPLRDGKLLNIAPEYAADLVSKTRRDDGPLEWAYHWLQAGPKADYVICAPENRQQLREIIKIIGKKDPLTVNEEATAYYVAGRVRNIEESLYCSGCLFCEGKCPVGLDVRYLMQLLVDMQVERTPSLIRQYLALPKEMRASACIGCGRCIEFCQKIHNVPFHMRELAHLAGEC